MELHRSEVFFYLLASFILGVFAASFFSFSYVFTHVFLIIGVGGLAIFWNNKKAMIGIAIFIALIGGIIRFNSFNFYVGNILNSVGLASPKPTAEHGREIILRGYVDDEPEADEEVQRFVFNSGHDRILITTATYPRYKFGDFIEVSGNLELPRNFSEDFDYAAYLKKDGIRVTLFFPEISKYEGELGLERGEIFKLQVYKNIFKLKEKFQTAINKSISEPNASFINGILLGTRQNIPDDLKENFNKTGTTHILAISGYNIMIISEAVLLCLIWFVKRRVAFWISVVIIILFVILTGASASVVRAAVMGLTLSFAHGYGRLYDQKNSIILAGGTMIWINPFVLVFDIGFQLSFVAVMGLIYLYPYIDSKLYKLTWLGNIKELILMTLSAQLAVAPLLIYYFGNFSVVSLPTNVLILPFIPFAMLFGFISGLAGMLFLSAGQMMGYIAWAITSYQIWIVEFFAQL